MIKILGSKLEIAQKIISNQGYKNIIIKKNDEEKLNGETIVSNYKILKDSSTIILVVSNFKLAV